MDHTPTILIIDDNPNILKTLADILEAKAYQPVAVADGKAALKIVEEYSPLVALIDLKLEGMSGLELLRKIKKLSPSTECIVITGNATLETAVEAIGLGAYSYMLKPYEVEQLLLTINRAIEKGQAEKAVRESEAKYRSLFDNVPIGLYRTSINGQFHEANQALVEMLGYPSRAELLAINVEEIYPERDMRDNVISRLDEVDLIFDDEIRLVRKDGEFIWVSISTRGIKDEAGKLVFLEGSLRDITEQKRMAAERNRIFELPENLLLVVRSDLTIVDVSVGWKVVLGHTPDDMLAKSSLDFIHPYDTPEWQSSIGEIARGEARNNFENRFRHRDGSYRTLLWAMSADPESGLLYGAGKDISARKAAQERVRQEATRTQSLLQFASHLNTQLDLDTLLNILCEETARVLNVPAASLTLYDKLSETFFYAADFGLPPEFRQRAQPMPRAIYDEYTQQMGSLKVVPDLQAVSDLTNTDLYTALNLRTGISVSLVSEGEPVGGLNIFTIGKVRHFSKNELALLKGLADQTTLAINNAQLYTTAKEQAARLALLYDAGLALNSTLDPAAQMEFLFNIVIETLSANNAQFWRFYQARNEIRFEVGVGYREEVYEKLTKTAFEVDKELSGACWVVTHRLPLYIPDLTTDPSYVVIDPEVRSGLWVPIERNDQLLGVLAVFSTRENMFTPQDERLLILFANQAAIAMENARLFDEAQHRLDNLRAVRTIDMAISAGPDLQPTLNIILEKLASHLRVDAAHILLYDQDTQTLKHGSQRGFITAALHHTDLQLGEGHAGQAALKQRLIVVPNLGEDQGDFTISPLLDQEGFRSYYATPLLAKGQLKGVLEIFHRTRLDPDQEWLDFLDTLAAQSAIAIEDAAIFADLQRANADLNLAYDNTLEGWVRALDLRDKETEGHIQRVTERTLRLSRAMEVSSDELVHIRRGALLHDIGKMGIPDRILHKPGPLNDEEWEFMRQHPVYAHEFLAPIAYLRPALEIPYCHHERWDGTGYPRGLKGEQIPLAARVFAVVDVWDALVSDRTYGKAWTEEEARAYIGEQSESHFDAQVVEAFLKMNFE